MYNATPCHVQRSLSPEVLCRTERVCERADYHPGAPSTQLNGPAQPRMEWLCMGTMSGAPLCLFNYIRFVLQNARKLFHQK